MSSSMFLQLQNETHQLFEKVHLLQLGAQVIGVGGHQSFANLASGIILGFHGGHLAVHAQRVRAGGSEAEHPILRGLLFVEHHLYEGAVLELHKFLEPQPNESAVDFS